mmetsp:Transcript_25876/g.53118  ORF Transcript_25876/g.53118 Transcript_25876/m.53118 type:complete len:93 (-) Transcript_25876:5-283(-)
MMSLVEMVEFLLKQEKRRCWLFCCAGGDLFSWGGGGREASCSTSCKEILQQQCSSKSDQILRTPYSGFLFCDQMCLHGLWLCAKLSSTNLVS